MPLAWEAGLTQQERRAFNAIYGDARVQNGIYKKMIKLVLASKAPGTISGYISAIEKWRSFAKRNNFAVFPPGRHEFSIYITDLSDKGTSYSSFKLITAAMPFLYAARNSEEQVITKTPFVKLIMEGAMRKASSERGCVKKANTFSEENIKKILTASFWPNGTPSLPNRSLKEWRTAVRLYTYYMTLCRYDCYSKLKISSFDFKEDHVVITYETRKNDQLYNGSSSILKFRRGELLCPQLVYQTYFRIMNLSGEAYLNCRLSNFGSKSRPNTKLSYSQSLKDTKDLLATHGINSASEKSFKASGVTILLDKKASLTDVQVFGGWKTENTPLYYHNQTVQRRMEISELL